MELFIIITVQAGIAGNPAVGTKTTTIQNRITVGLPVTREGIFKWVLSQLPDDLKGAPVLFYSAEPNHFPETSARPDVVTSGAAASASARTRSSPWPSSWWPGPVARAASRTTLCSSLITRSRSLTSSPVSLRRAL